jgi:transcription antitermination factor NusG
LRIKQPRAGVLHPRSFDPTRTRPLFHSVSPHTHVFGARVPILPAEPDCHPNDLLDQEERIQATWWLLYTKSRQEKQLMRHLRQLNLAHYAPQIAHRRRSPAGRIRTTYAPLFTNYVFLCGDNEARYEAVCTGCVQKATEITDVPQFITDLRQVRDLINKGVPLTLESRLEAGQHVRVRSGAFAGYEGTIIRREQETRLLVSVHFMEQGVSVKLEDCQLELIG